MKEIESVQKVEYAIIDAHIHIADLVGSHRRACGDGLKTLTRLFTSVDVT